MVYNDFRRETLLFPNRVKISHIEENKDEIVEIMLSYASKTASEKYSENKFYFDRLPKLLSDLNSLKKFLTDSQRKNLETKSWNTTNIVDLLFKASTMSQNHFETCLKA